MNSVTAWGQRLAVPKPPTYGNIFLSIEVETPLNGVRDGEWFVSACPKRSYSNAFGGISCPVISQLEQGVKRLKLGEHTGAT